MIVVSPHDRVFVLTGAGISAESGIPTFRDAGGIWAKYKPEKVATPAAFDADAKLVWQFYGSRRKNAAGVEPNPAHFALAWLEQQLGDRLLVCTQNVDQLHEKAGSRRVIHMHGELMKSRCERCDRPPFHDETAYDEVPRCGCGGRIRPHVCWFGEMPYQLDAVFEALERCSVFVAVGSSGTVEPAASFALWAGRSNSGYARKYYVGAEGPANRIFFDQVFIGKAGELLPALFRVGG
ncbi:MAG: NAD-dependent deacetylase [Terriglobales bacterium]